MEINQTPTSAGNINERWTGNIFENFKKLEDYERLAREGCESLMDYVSMPYHIRKAQLGLIQYKNLKMIITEFRLLIGDLAPLLTDKEDDQYLDWINNVQSVINLEGLFLETNYNIDGNLTQTKTTPFFEITLNTYADLKSKLIRTEKIKALLYVQSSKPW